MSPKYEKVNGSWQKVQYDYETKYLGIVARNGKYCRPEGYNSYRKHVVVKATGNMIPNPTIDPYELTQYPTIPEKLSLTEQEIIDTVFTSKNSWTSVRHEQARCMLNTGYGGPVSSGEVRVLKRTFQELGLADNFRNGHLLKKVRIPAHGRSRGYTSERLQACYLFKSPLPKIPWQKFVALARLYKTDEGGLNQAIKAMLNNPNVKDDLDSLDTLEILSKLK